MLNGEADRIVEHQALSQPETNLNLLLGSDIEQGPSRAYLLEDMIVADGSLLARTSYSSIVSARRRPVIRQASLEGFKEAAFCSSKTGELFFGHWLTETLSTELLAARQAWLPLTLSGVRRSHEDGYRQLSGLEARKVLSARVERLWLLEDYELNKDRAERLETIRRRLRNGAARGKGRYFISRGETGVGRQLANEPEVRAALERAGFTILEPEKTSAESIVSQLREAQIVAAVEGSAFAHAIMAVPNDATLLVLQPPKHFNMVWKTYTAALDLRFACLVGDPLESDRFTQPIDRLLDMVELIDGAYRA